MTDSAQIRPVVKSEFPDVLRVAAAAFGEEYSQEDADAFRAGFPWERSLAAFENGKMVALSAVLSLELSVPGGVAIPMGGLTWIATLPTHRRRGLLTNLMAASFADMTRRGEIVSGLGASEGNIYGRFGYGPAASVVSFGVERAHAALAAPLDTVAAGSFALLDADEAAGRLPAIYDSLRRQQHGAVSRSPAMWQAYLADPPLERGGATRMFHVVHETLPGTADGYVTYRTKAEFEGATALNAVHVIEVLAANPMVYRALWKFVLETDLCHTVSCERGRVDEPLRWLLADPRRFKVDELFDFLWLRLLDVPRALAARRYAAAGQVVLEVTDPFPTTTSERYLLRVAPAAGEVAPGAAFALPAECTPTSSDPDLALDAGILASAYLGGVSFATLAAAGRVRELTPGAAGRADAMFLTSTAPFSATEF
jgi:predicted acetyltransferase